MAPRYKQFRIPSDSQGIVYDQFNIETKPRLYLDGALHYLSDLKSPISGETCLVYGSNPKSLPKICELVEVADLRLAATHCADLSPLQRIRRLRNLQIRWNTKLIDLEAIGCLANLELLVLQSTQKITDIAPLGKLKHLEILEIDSGMWNVIKLKSLDPLNELPKLEELYLCGIRSSKNGLKPLAKCHSLRYLALPNKFPMEDYAFLSASLVNVTSPHFQPWVPLKVNGVDYCVFLTKGIGALDPTVDSDRIQKLEIKFRHLQSKFAAEIARQPTM